MLVRPTNFSEMENSTHQRISDGIQKLSEYIATSRSSFQLFYQREI